MIQTESREVGAYEAKTHLPRLLDRVARGEHITITRHGKPVARLVPIQNRSPEDIQKAIEALRNFRIPKPFTQAEILALIKGGHRY